MTCISEISTFLFVIFLLFVIFSSISDAFSHSFFSLSKNDQQQVTLYGWYWSLRWKCAPHLMLTISRNTENSEAANALLRSIPSSSQITDVHLSVYSRGVRLQSLRATILWLLDTSFLHPTQIKWLNSLLSVSFSSVEAWKPAIHLIRCGREGVHSEVAGRYLFRTGHRDP